MSVLKKNIPRFFLHSSGASCTVVHYALSSRIVLSHRYYLLIHRTTALVDAPLSRQSIPGPNRPKRSAGARPTQSRTQSRVPITCLSLHSPRLPNAPPFPLLSADHILRPQVDHIPPSLFFTRNEGGKKAREKHLLLDLTEVLDVDLMRITLTLFSLFLLIQFTSFLLTGGWHQRRALR